VEFPGKKTSGHKRRGKAPGGSSQFREARLDWKGGARGPGAGKLEAIRGFAAGAVKAAGTA